MPDDFTFLRESLPRGPVADIELQNWNFDDLLNRPGAGHFQAPLSTSEEDLDPYRTGIYVLRNGQIEWGGILLPPTLSVDGSMLDLNVFGWMGYWDRRGIRGQPEAGGVGTFKPSADSVATNVVPNPDTQSPWELLRSPFSSSQPPGVVSVGIGATPLYRANFDIGPDDMEEHAIASVTLVVIADSDPAQNLTLRLRIGGVNYDASPVTLTRSPEQYTNTWTTNPATGIAWTAAQVQAFASSSSAGFTTNANVGLFGVGVWSMYLVVNYVGSSGFLDGVDQFDIFRRLVMDAQDEAKFGAGYDLGIDVVWDALSGVVRDRADDYRFFKAKNLGEALRQIAAVDDGFDYSMEYTIGSDDRIDKQIRLFYPRKGRNTGFVYEYDTGEDAPERSQPNVLGRGFSSPDDFAWAGDGWGAGNDETRLRSDYIDDVLRGVYPVFDAAPSWSSVIRQDALDENTLAWFGRRNRVHRYPIFRVDPDAYPRFVDVATGDTVIAKIDDGYGSTTPITGDPFRIVQKSVKDSGATHIVSLGDPAGAEAESEE